MSDRLSVEDVRREQDLALRAVAESVRREVDLALRAVAESVNERLADIRPVAVTVDTTPIARSVDRMTEAIVKQSELLARLVGVVASQKPPTVEVNPTIEVQQPPAPAPVRKKPRKLVVQHDDGSKSTITDVTDG